MASQAKLSYRAPSNLPHPRTALLGLLAGLLLALAGCQSSTIAEPEERLIPSQGGVSDALNRYLLKADAAAGSPYRDSYPDLDGDGLTDALVILQGPDWCGLSGCPLLVFRGTSSGHFIFLSRTEPVREPVRLSQNRTNGWRDLVVSTTVQGRPEDVLLSFGLEGYTADASQAEPWDNSRQLPTEPAF
jgi:hypothetical protein